MYSLVSITAATPGYYAVFVKDGVRHKLPIVIWGLSETNHVTPLVLSSSGHLVMAEKFDDYIGVVHEMANS